MKPAAEILLTCPWCRQHGFTERGLRAHVCRSAPGGKRRQLSAPALRTARKAAGLVKPRLPKPAPLSPSFVKMAKPNTTTALAVIGSPELKADAKQLALLKTSAEQQFKRLAEMRHEEALRGLLLGLTLHRVKASLPYGEFGKWAKAHATFGERWVNYLMKLALVFIDKSKATKPELLACPGDQTELAIEGQQGLQRQFTLKANKFTAGLSLSELLDKYEIKSGAKLGGARGAAEKEDATPEQLAARARTDLSDWVTQGRQLLLQDNVCQWLPAEDTRAVADSLDALRTEWRASLKRLLAAAPKPVAAIPAGADEA